MRAVVQRVREARVEVAGEVTGSIGPGLLVLLGITHEDGPAQVAWLARKLVDLRIFSDQDGKMNLSLRDTGGDILLVSQFTLYGDARKGNRPSYVQAAPPAVAIPLYEAMVAELSELTGKTIQTGIFGADMQVSLLNDGPVTIIVDTT
jgi:D-tyrosyl-tRNA(Tyr) deacylase